MKKENPREKRKTQIDSDEAKVGKGGSTVE